MNALTRKELEKGQQTNMEVDYVIVYRFATSDKLEAAQKFQKLCEKLASVGFATEVRVGDDHSLLIFVKVASEEHFFGEVYRSRWEIPKQYDGRKSDNV